MICHFGRRLFAVLGLAVIKFGLLSGCAVAPYRPIVATSPVTSECDSSSSLVQTTPETPATKPYTLHFIEFDDQGWLYPDVFDSNGIKTSPSEQIDGAIGDIVRRLEGSGKVLVFTFVHGWKHSARENDDNLVRFCNFLRRRAELIKDRQIVGVYIGWKGDTLDFPGFRNLTFWGRKNAAHRIADGRVREFFARMRGLREYWNSLNGCDTVTDSSDECKLRSVMIGHSFGGLILHNSAAPYILETLALRRDLPAGYKSGAQPRARGLADLIVLINPAFEASRHEALFAAARLNKDHSQGAPLMLMVTTTEDNATKNAFPVARWINTIFQYPATSEDQSIAMKRTPGHVDYFLTHALCLTRDGNCTEAAGVGRPRSADLSDIRYCGDLLLVPLSNERNLPIWNIRSSGSIMSDHGDFANVHLVQFIEQIYSKVDKAHSTDACSGDYQQKVIESNIATPSSVAP